MKDDGLLQFVESQSPSGRRPPRQAPRAELFNLNLVLQEFRLHTLRVGVVFIDLVDGDDHRDLRLLG